MKFKTVLAAMILVLPWYAYAGKLFTPTLWAVAPDALACNLTNVSNKTRVVRVRIITNGQVLLDSGEISLEPQHTTDHEADGLAEGAPIYCEFEVQGAKKSYRGVAKLFHLPNSSDFVAVPAT